MLDPAQEKQRRDRLRRTGPSDIPDLVFGAENIAKLTGQKVSAVYYWASRGMYGDAVWKAGRKSMVASRRRLSELGRQHPEI